MQPLASAAGPAVAVIPARFASERFPGKPLADIAGVPMIVRVCRQAAKARLDAVYVATDDERIAHVVRGAGFAAVMTSPACASGSDRVAEVVRGLAEPVGVVVNVQGDEPLVDPRDIDALVDATVAHPEAIGTLARPLTDPERFTNPNVVKVVRAPSGRALYFSRGPIPYGLDGASDGALQHVGLYAYHPGVLARFTALAPTPLERRERLEQLRALENEIPIHVTMCVSDRPSIGVDVPSDVEAVLEALKNP